MKADASSILAIRPARPGFSIHYSPKRSLCQHSRRNLPLPVNVIAIIELAGP